MPRLILLNGPPGCGKSTLARCYVDEHPLTLALDVDGVRGMLGGWRANLHPAGLAARALALDMARTHLRAGYDVVIPQYLGRPNFIEALESLASDVGILFAEVVLLADRHDALRRFEARRAAAAAAGRDDVLARTVSSEELLQMYERLVALLPTRPRAHVVHTVDGEIQQAYEAVLEMVGWS